MFELCGKLGYLPEQILDLQFWQFLALVAGYLEGLQDISAMSVTTGYWSAYYNNSKRAKSPKTIISQMRAKSHTRGGGKKPKPEVDRFEELERRRLQFLRGDSDAR